MFLRPQRFWSSLAWLAACSPALLILAVLAPARVAIPYHDSFDFVLQYQKWMAGHYSWQEFFAFHKNHPSAFAKMIYFIVLRWLRGDVGLLSLFSWLLSVGISACLLVLSRPLWRGRLCLGAGLLFLINLSVFTAAQGHTWIWDFMYVIFIPGLALVLGLVLLRGGAWPWVRLAACGVLSLCAAFSFGTGFVVPWLLAPAVASYLGGQSRRRFTLGLALWLAWSALVAALVWKVLAFGATHEMDGSLEKQMDRPVMVLHYLLVELGHTLGQGTLIEPTVLTAIVGGALTLLMLACLGSLAWRREAAAWRASVPWLTLCLWAWLNALAVCLGRMAGSVQTAMSPRYGAFSLFYVLGVAFLAATVWGDGAGQGLARAWRVSRPYLIGVLLVLQATSWLAGINVIELYSKRMQVRMALICMAPIVPTNPDEVWEGAEISEALEGAQFLKSQKRWKGAEFLQSADIHTFRKRAEINSKWAHWELVHRTGETAVACGEWLAQGTCGLSRDTISLPDMILLTAQADEGPENIIVMARPLLPDNFEDFGYLRRQYAAHYFGWERSLKAEQLPPGKQRVIRAYALDIRNWSVRPLEASFTIPGK